ncbi:hypothetical protein ACLMJK_008847 [Lecanora helva]
MPSRVSPSKTRETSPPSESEESFVSAASATDERLSSRKLKDARIGQSAKLIPSSQHHSVAATVSPKQTRTNNNAFDKNNSSTASLKALVSPLSPPEPSYFSVQPGADPRFSLSRRPPASRSSHGIETKSGPPPALSTQRSYTDSPRRASPSPSTRTVHPPLKLPLNPTSNTGNQSYDSTEGKRRAEKSEIVRVAHSRPSTSDGVMHTVETKRFGRSGNEEDQDTTLRIGDPSLRNGRERGADTQEDLFLNLARDDEQEEVLSRNQRRRSRFGTSSFSRPSSSSRPSTSGGTFASQQNLKKDHSHATSFDSAVPVSPRIASLTSLRDPLSRSRPYAASAHPLDQRHQTRNSRTSLGPTNLDSPSDERSSQTPMPHGRRRSIRQSSPTRLSPPYRHGSVRGEPHTEGTESTVSTTAPSTVWDELDDLKSRLRKLELTGLLPKSSNAAISTVNGDRPPTASTTVTTMSASPKRRQKESSSPETSTIKTSGQNGVHPLLQTALAKAKASINPDTYRALEATASDALVLAAMTGSTGLQGAPVGSPSIVGPASGVDRQLRRKADSMCRSLTELCIALAEDLPENEDSKGRPKSRDTISKQEIQPAPKLLRGASDEYEPRASSRVMSRLEARRASLLNSSPLNGRRDSSQGATTPTQTSTPLSSKPDEDSSLLARRRSTAQNIDSSNIRRPPSRAATEVGQMRPSPQTRISREYTSQHPMPPASQQSPSVQSSLPMRKSYFGSATSSPLTPNVQPGNRRYLDRSTPSSSADSSTRLAEARQRRIASLGQSQSRIGLSTARMRLSDSEQQQ